MPHRPQGDRSPRKRQGSQACFPPTQLLALLPLAREGPHASVALGSLLPLTLWGQNSHRLVTTEVPVAGTCVRSSQRCCLWGSDWKSTFPLLYPSVPMS